MPFDHNYPLTQFRPEWTFFAPGRRDTTLMFSCPCGCGAALVIPLKNPLDKGRQDDRAPHAFRWKRVGESFDTLTITPTIHVLENMEIEAGTLPGPSSHWYGLITEGRVFWSNQNLK